MQKVVKVFKNFLSAEEHRVIYSTMLNTKEGQGALPWYYGNKTQKQEDYQFTHIFFDQSQLSANFSLVQPILQKINPKALVRIKANMSTKEESSRLGGWHYDMQYQDGTPWTDNTTAVYYVNDNNGWTEFEDGTKFISKANTFVCFPNDLKHTGFSQTDENVRVLINFNYYV